MKNPVIGANPSGPADKFKKADSKNTDDGKLGSQATPPREDLVSTLGDTMAPPPDSEIPAAVITGKFPIFQWERYEFIKLLGKGGMGAVYKARDPRLNRTLALKFIHSGDEETILRFTQEARAQAQIDHPGICKVYEVGEVEGKAYIAMQLIDGPSLQQAASQLSITEKSEVIRDAAWALHAAHELGIIHRDVKPANIMLEEVQKDKRARHYRPIVMDFGLAREQHKGKGLTATGTMMGTPAYMPPEQARGETELIDRRSDVYSLGATLYELLAGKPPFDGNSMVDILFKVMNHQPAALRSVITSVPEPLETIVSKCLNKDPGRRYPTAQALAEDLERFLRGEPIQGKRLSAVHQISWQARRNKPVTALLVTLMALIMAISTYLLQARTRRLAAELQAKQQDDAHQKVAQRLGQEVEQILWLIRLVYFSPLHDISKEEQSLRRRLDDIEKPKNDNPLAASYHYSLGLSYFALHDLKQADFHLSEAEKAGVNISEFNFTKIRLLDAQCRKELEKQQLNSRQNRKPTEKSKRAGASRNEDRDDSEAEVIDFKGRKNQIEADFFQKIQPYLKNIQKSSTIPQSYLQALIEYRKRNHEQAIEAAKNAEQEAPWFYESTQLIGDIYNTRAIDYLFDNNSEKAEQYLREAIKAYERAIEFGRSDPQLYSSLASARNSLLILEVDQFRLSENSLNQAIDAARNAIKASPSEANFTLIIQSYINYARYLQQKGDHNSNSRLEYINKAIETGENAILVNADNPELCRVISDAYIQRANILSQISSKSDQYDQDISKAESFLNKAISKNSTDLSLYSSILHLYRTKASHLQMSGGDPTSILENGLETSIPSQLGNGQNNYIVNRLLIYLMLARYNLDHGKSSDKLIGEAETLLTSYKKTKSSSQTIMGSLYCTQASYCIYAGCSTEELLSKALQNAEEAKKISNKNWNRPYIVITWAWAIKALSYLQKKQSLDEVVDRGLQIGDECRETSSTESSCYTHQATLLWAQGRWNLSQGKNIDNLLKGAREVAQNAVTRNIDIAQKQEDAFLALARIHYLSALAASAEKTPARKKIDDAASDALEALEKALSKRPDKPQAFALQGAVFLLRAKFAKAAAERLKFAKQADERFKLALNKNPLLVNSYLREVNETSTLLKRAGL